MKIAARDLEELGIVDEIVEEPNGGAHRDPVASAGKLASTLSRALGELEPLDAEELVTKRIEKYASIGVWA